MKLRIKKTGEILEDVKFIDTSLHKITIQYLDDGVLRECVVENLLDVEEVKDYEEPTTYYYISDFGATREGDVGKFVEDEIVRKEIGNYFETEEEAKKSVEKLEAWKRLKDKGFRFDGYDVTHNSNGDLCGQLFYNAGNYCIGDVEKHLDLLFGGEE